MLWKARQHEFRFPRPTLILGIVNVTPDSFSDGGRFPDPEAAVEHGLSLIRAGADMLDIGGESTRPGAAPVAEAEELRRVLPVVAALARSTSVPLSIDTTKPSVAEAAIEAGASIVNDVGAAWPESRLAGVAASTGAGYIAMHMQGRPQTMQVNPVYADVTREVFHSFELILDGCERAGLKREQVALDPGIGFGKTLAHNLELLARMGLFRELARPLVLGVSRKSFLGKVVGDLPVADRLAGGLAATSLAVARGVSVVRTHDVRETVHAVRVAEAIAGVPSA